jgi:rod shape-determining protein MreC
MAMKENRTCERILFSLLILAGFIVLFAPKSFTNKLQFAFIRVFKGPLGICRNFTQIAAGSQQSSVNVVEQSQYLELRNHLANNMQWLRQELQNVEKLSGLRSRSVWKDVDFVLADIITAFTDTSRNELIINRGRDDGLAQGQFAVNDDSIIGIITDLDSHTARVQLLTDLRSKVAVKIGNLDLQYIMQGNGDGSASIQLVPEKYNNQNGDIIYVQKKPGFLDVSMIAGIVTQCKTYDENPLLCKLTVEPVYEMKDIKSVTVIVMNSQKYNKEGNDKAST